MRIISVVVLITLFHFNGMAQEKKKLDIDTMLLELSANSCLCIDSIDVYNKSKAEIDSEISTCIDQQIPALQLFSQLLNIDELATKKEPAEGKIEVDVAIDLDKKSASYTKYYYQLERQMMSNCEALKDKVSRNEKQSAKSFSSNPKARSFYSQALDASEKENYEAAIVYLEKAVKEDPEFAFAWDNLGLNYRRLNKFDKAINAYEKSLKIDPNGIMPLQNIAVAYQYKKEYAKAIKSYEQLAKLDSNNPEIYYGIGTVCAYYLNDLEKGLINLCKAYNLYVKQKSPYRVDAEKGINIIYGKMKEQGQIERFNQILASHKLEPTK